MIYYHDPATQQHRALHTGYSNEIPSSFSSWREAGDIPTTRTSDAHLPRRCEQAQFSKLGACYPCTTDPALQAHLAALPAILCVQ